MSGTAIGKSDSSRRARFVASTGRPELHRPLGYHRLSHESATGALTDNRTPESRSALMARIGGKHTAPEVCVRRMLHSLGYRFRLHRKDLPGTPDIVFPSRRRIVFVNGCFWHAHGCKIGMPPKSRSRFWTAKCERNRARDQRNVADLRSMGWRTLTVWQCETRVSKRMERKLRAFLGPPGEIRSTSSF